MADAAAPAPRKAAAPAAPAKSVREQQLEAELGAVRAQLAQREEALRMERRSTDPRSPHYDAEAAQAEAWPTQVREDA